MSDESEPLRFHAYYYSFEPTGERTIDLILNAVAWAGKAYHHTVDWTEELDPYPNTKGTTCADWIGHAAHDAAEEIARLRQALSSVHLALGESPDSDDASLGEVVARHLRDRDERIGEMAQRAAELERERDGCAADARSMSERLQRAIEGANRWREAAEIEAGNRLATEQERDEAHAFVTEVREALGEHYAGPETHWRARSIASIGRLVAALASEMGELEGALREAQATLCDVVDEQGIEHVMDCPEDDTCECTLVARVNDAISGASRALLSPAPSPGTDRSNDKE